MRLLILSASARFIASSSVRAGVSFRAVDFFGDWDLQQFCVGPRENVNKCRRVDNYQELLVSLGDPCDCAVLGGGLENEPELIRQLNRQVPVVGTCAAQLDRLIDTGNYEVLAVSIRSAGGIAPQTKTIITAHDDPAAWLRKKTAGAGGRHVRFASVNDINQQVSDDHVFQQHIEGESVSAVFVVDVDGPRRSCKLLGVSRQLVGETNLGASPFAYCGSIGPLDPGQYDFELIEGIGQAISSEFQIAGVFGIDFIVNSAGVWPVDINPRIPSSAEIFELNEVLSPADRLATNCSSSIVAIHLAACGGEFVNSMADCIREKKSNTDKLGKGILFWRPTESVVFDHWRLKLVTEEHWNMQNGKPPGRWVADIPCPGRIIRHGDPLLSLFVREPTEKLVHENLLRYAAELESALATGSGMNRDRKRRVD